jgi:predicted nucleic acid-binding protein
MWLTSLHRAEWTHTIAQHVFRGVLSHEDASRFYIAFEADREANVWADISFPDAAYETATELARKHGPQIPMRTLDTLHVACALELGAREFWTFDERQKRLAKTVGLSTS